MRDAFSRRSGSLMRLGVGSGVTSNRSRRRMAEGSSTSAASVWDEALGYIRSTVHEGSRCGSAADTSRRKEAVDI